MKVGSIHKNDEDIKCCEKKCIRKLKWEIFIKKKIELVQDGDISGMWKRWEMGSNSLPPPKTNVVKICIRKWKW